jgi:hypothetical protein
MFCPPDNQVHFSYSVIEHFDQYMAGILVQVEQNVPFSDPSLLRVFNVFAVPSHGASQLSPVALLDRVCHAEKKQQVTALLFGHNAKLFFKALPALFIQKGPEGIGWHHANSLRFDAPNKPTGSFRCRRRYKNRDVALRH